MKQGDTHVIIGLIGLGKMGFALGEQMLEKGHTVLATDVSEASRASFEKVGGKTVRTSAELVSSLQAPRVVWLMVPQGKIVDQVLSEILPRLDAGDIVIEAGNSQYKDSMRRAKEASDRGIAYLDVGTSGGVEGARHGACYMIGGEKEAFLRVEELFSSTAVKGGYAYVGPSGSGHYAKMVHNGIEYGMMAAIGEGFEILQKSPFPYELGDVANVFTNGSVIRGWLMDLTARALEKDPNLTSIRGVMHSSGEGKWTLEEALDLQVASPVIALSLMMRYRSQETDTFTGKVVAALRNEFGGHAVEKAGE